MNEEIYSVRVVLSGEEIMALAMPYPGEREVSDYWRDYDARREARKRGRTALRRALEGRTRYERPADLEGPAGNADEPMVRVLMLSEEAEALLMRFPGDGDPVGYWEDFHARRTTRAVARNSLERALENHLRSAI